MEIKMINARILLVTKASGKNFSIEAALNDGKKNFDHHGNFSGEKSPCNNPEISIIENERIIEISHLDADTFIGLKRMLGIDLPNIDLDLMEKIDLNGSSVCEDKFDPTLLYMVGVGSLVREKKFPRVTSTAVEVTELVYSILCKSDEFITDVGEKAQTIAEDCYGDKKIWIRSNPVGIWSIGPEDQFDPSRPYEDGTDIVVVFREHYKSISIYCNPKTKYQFADETIAGVMFAGHPKACGSPRGQEMTFVDAIRVYKEIYFI